MLTIEDLKDRYRVKSRKTVMRWVADELLPPPLRIGGVLRWREQDLDAFDEYQLACQAYRNQTGRDPYAADSCINPPVFSHGIPFNDPRQANARIAERQRRAKSKTLRAAEYPDAIDASIETSRVFVGDQLPADVVEKFTENAQ